MSRARVVLTKVQERELERSTVVPRLVRRLTPRAAPLKAEDLRSIGHEREFRAAADYDPNRQVPFEAFTYPPVHREMSRQIAHARKASQREVSGTLDASYEYLQRAEDRGDVLMDTDEQSRTHISDHYAGILGSMLASAMSASSVAPNEEELIARQDLPRLRAAIEAALEAIGEAGPIFRLRHFENCTWDEVAKRVGMTVRTAQRTYDDAMPRLCALLAKARR